ncbi:MAG: hypothetical protein CMD25_09010 [Flavobacteriales bacterium]|nr:hypothetical protein [Flavobacteriales bacterium]|tara:strand:- start:1677 stop:2189 length:513 start_codon:yes stop_codon:yes gene_type:complete
MTKKNKYGIWIKIISVVIPLVVAILFRVKIDYDLPIFLPPIYATINAITALLLVFALIAIKRKQIELHQRLMQSCIVLSLLFLVMYIAYHMTTDPTPFLGTGSVKTLYFFILISHIILSVALIPLVLISYVRAFQKEFPEHKKISKITFPIWLYVAVTGVIVYIMISPYY